MNSNVVVKTVAFCQLMTTSQPDPFYLHALHIWGLYRGNYWQYLIFLNTYYTVYHKNVSYLGNT